MSTLKIPARVEVTCDSCRKVCESSDRRMSGGLTIKRDGVDYQGSPVGDASRSYDLCDRCVMHFEQLVEQELKMMKHHD